MKKISVLLMAVFMLSGTNLIAQKITVKSGSVAPLKGQQTVLVKYDYSNLSVGKFDKEEDYIAEKVEDYNKSEAGKGDKWKEAWVNDRSTRYEPKFEKLFNEDSKLKADKETADTQYEMLVHTTFIEPGFNVGVTRRPAYINVTVTIKEVSTGKEIVVINALKSPGRDAFGFDFDTGYRIEEAYAKLGKSLAKFLNKQI